MDSPLVQLIRDAFAGEATDVFFTEGEPPRVRRDGEVVELHPGPVSREAMARFWSACKVDAETRSGADLSWGIPDGRRLRVNLYRSLGRLAAVLRPIKNRIPPLAELGLPAPLLESWMARRYGLVLVTGPTGSGLSSTASPNALLGKLPQTRRFCLVWSVQTIDSALERPDHVSHLATVLPRHYAPRTSQGRLHTCLPPLPFCMAAFCDPNPMPLAPTQSRTTC